MKMEESFGFKINLEIAVPEAGKAEQQSIPLVQATLVGKTYR